MSDPTPQLLAQTAWCGPARDVYGKSHTLGQSRSPKRASGSPSKKTPGKLLPTAAQGQGSAGPFPRGSTLLWVLKPRTSHSQGAGGGLPKLWKVFTELVLSASRVLKIRQNWPLSPMTMEGRESPQLSSHPQQPYLGTPAPI